MGKKFGDTDINKDFIKNGAKQMSTADLEKIIKKSDEIEKKFNLGALKRFYDDFLLLISLAKDYWNGNYREIPYSSIAAVIFTLIYVLNPIDLVPDFIPVVGLLDDAAVVALCLKMIEADLKKYETWKSNQ